MPVRPSVMELPPEIRKRLDEELLRRNFSGYAELFDLVSSLGAELEIRIPSKSSLHRYGQKLERQLRAVKTSTEAAKLIAESSPDEEDARSAAVLSMLQTQVFDVLVNLQEAEEAENPIERLKILNRASQAAADLARASVSQKKWASSVRGKVSAAFRTLETEATGPKPSIDPETLRRVREEIYGVL